MAITPQQIDDILDGISQGLSVKEICRENDYSEGLFYRELSRDEVLVERYARAREAQSHKYAADIVDISDDRSIPAEDRRLMMDSRKWAAGKLAPKKYGDQVRHDHKHTGDLSVKSDDQLESRIAQLLGKAGVASAVGGEGPPGGNSEG